MIPALLQNALFDRSWKWRRVAVFGALIWLAGLITYIGIFGDDDRLRQEMSTALITLFGATITAYVFGSIADDRFKDRAAIDMQKTAQPPSATDPPQ